MCTTIAAMHLTLVIGYFRHRVRHQPRSREASLQVEDDGMKFQGPLRLKALVGVPESELQFVYYNQAFGYIPV
jgi:hypothetical protein